MTASVAPVSRSGSGHVSRHTPLKNNDCHPAQTSHLLDVAAASHHHTTPHPLTAQPPAKPWKACASPSARRASALSLLVLPAEEQIELEDCFVALGGAPTGFICFKHIARAYELVLGAQHASERAVKDAFDTMGPNMNGQVDKMAFRAYMLSNWNLATPPMSEGSAAATSGRRRSTQDVHLVGMRLADVVRMYRRKTLAERTLKKAQQHVQVQASKDTSQLRHSSSELSPSPPAAPGPPGLLRRSLSRRGIEAAALAVEAQRTAAPSAAHPPAETAVVPLSRLRRASMLMLEAALAVEKQPPPPLQRMAGVPEQDSDGACSRQQSVHEQPVDVDEQREWEHRILALCWLNSGYRSAEGGNGGDRDSGCEGFVPVQQLLILHDADAAEPRRPRDPLTGLREGGGSRLSSAAQGPGLSMSQVTADVAAAPPPRPVAFSLDLLAPLVPVDLSSESGTAACSVAPAPRPVACSVDLLAPLVPVDPSSGAPPPRPVACGVAPVVPVGRGSGAPPPRPVACSEDLLAPLVPVDLSSGAAPRDVLHFMMSAAGQMGSDSWQQADQAVSLSFCQLGVSVDGLEASRSGRSSSSGSSSSSSSGSSSSRGSSRSSASGAGEEGPRGAGAGAAGADGKGGVAEWVTKRLTRFVDREDEPANGMDAAAVVRRSSSLLSTMSMRRNSSSLARSDTSLPLGSGGGSATMQRSLSQLRGSGAGGEACVGQPMPQPAGAAACSLLRRVGSTRGLLPSVGVASQHSGQPGAFASSPSGTGFSLQVPSLLNIPVVAKAKSSLLGMARTDKAIVDVHWKLTHKTKRNQERWNLS